MVLKKRSLRHWFKRKDDPGDAKWSDPLDPHGDGTLRKGDPVFDGLMRSHVVMGNFGPNGWEFKESER